MDFSIVWADSALEDLRQIVKYIAADNTEAAKRVGNAIIQSVEKPFELHDGDCVLFQGNSLIERSVEYGHLESVLALRFPDRDIMFRHTTR